MKGDSDGYDCETAGVGRAPAFRWERLHEHGSALQGPPVLGLPPTRRAGGAAFVIGDAVKGGQYGEYPSRKAEDLTQGDLAPNLDFRGLYSTILEDWLHVDAKPIVKGAFEKPRFL